jgi:excisionase family DNA binding protein
VTQTRLLRVEEVADLLSCSRRTVYTMLALGQLRGTRLSRRAVRISEAELARFLSVSTTGGATA